MYHLGRRLKALYSAKGLYVLFDGEDRKVTARFTNDFEDLWTEDVMTTTTPTSVKQQFVEMRVRDVRRRQLCLVQSPATHVASP